MKAQSHFCKIVAILAAMFLFLRVLPAISIFEMRTLLPEAQVLQHQAHWRRTARVHRILRKRAPCRSDLLLRRMRPLVTQGMMHLLSLVAPVPTSEGSQSLLAPPQAMSSRCLVTIRVVALAEPAPQ